MQLKEAIGFRELLGLDMRDPAFNDRMIANTELKDGWEALLSPEAVQRRTYLEFSRIFWEKLEATEGELGKMIGKKILPKRAMEDYIADLCEKSYMALEGNHLYKSALIIADTACQLENKGTNLRKRLLNSLFATLSITLGLIDLIAQVYERQFGHPMKMDEHRRTIESADFLETLLILSRISGITEAVFIEETTCPGVLNHYDRDAFLLERTDEQFKLKINPRRIAAMKNDVPKKLAQPNAPQKRICPASKIAVDTPNGKISVSEQFARWLVKFYAEHHLKNIHIT